MKKTLINLISAGILLTGTNGCDTLGEYSMIEAAHRYNANDAAMRGDYKAANAANAGAVFFGNMADAEAQRQAAEAGKTEVKIEQKFYIDKDGTMYEMVPVRKKSGVELLREEQERNRQY